MASPLSEPLFRQHIVNTAEYTKHIETDFMKQLALFRHMLQNGTLTNLESLLPLFFNIRGKPMTLTQHAPFEELYNFDMAMQTVLRTARQVGKSSLLATLGVGMTATLPYFSLLFIAPLFEQIRKFSNNYVGPLIEQSNIRSMLLGVNTTNSVLQRSFKNQSKLLFAYAFTSVDRVRGSSSHCFLLDETQDMDSRFIPVIRECTSFFTDWKMEWFTGTPKTKDNFLEGMFQGGSQAEWFVPCLHCTTNGYPTWNIPSLEFHASAMIGPYHSGISEKYPGTICHKCGQPISPALGHWVHRFPDRQWDCASYHIPQIVMPFHYASNVAWKKILEKQQGKNNTTPSTFWNEVMGESYDVSTKLVSQTELQSVAVLGKCHPTLVASRKSDYLLTSLAADWGGGGEQGVSFTTLAFLGLRRDGVIEVPWGIRLLTPHDHIKEAEDTFAFWRYFNPDLFAHDYTGAGSLRETFIVQKGVPLSKIMPCMYVRSASGAPCYHVRATEQHPRNHYRLDKTRTLLLTSAMIRTKQMLFFNYDHNSDDDPGLLHDFLALIEDKVTTSGAGEIYRISRAHGFTDDFAQAVNIGAVSLWHRSKQWPNLLANIPTTMSIDQQEAAGPENPVW